MAFGQSNLPKWVLWTIEFIWVLEFPLNCHDKTIPSQNHIFRDPFLIPKRSPGQIVDPRSKHLILGSKIHPWARKNKRCALKKPCRMQSSEFQTEPYSASYGQKPFWRATLTYWYMSRVKSWSQKGKSFFDKGNPVPNSVNYFWIVGPRGTIWVPKWSLKGFWEGLDSQMEALAAVSRCLRRFIFFKT